MVLQVKSRKRLAKTVLVFVGLFAICWLPSHVIYLYRSYHYSEVHEIYSFQKSAVAEAAKCRGLRFCCTLPLQQVDTSMAHFVGSIIARILAFTNSCLNPFALYLISKSFKKQFNQHLCCCCRAVLKHPLPSPTNYTGRGTSVRSTHQSVASLSINGRWLYQEDCV